MSPTWRAIFFTAAVVLAFIAALPDLVTVRKLNLFALAFAVFVVPFAYDALDAATN